MAQFLRWDRRQFLFYSWDRLATVNRIFVASFPGWCQHSYWYFIGAAFYNWSHAVDNDDQESDLENKKWLQSKLPIVAFFVSTVIRWTLSCFDSSLQFLIAHHTVPTGPPSNCSNYVECCAFSALPKSAGTMRTFELWCGQWPGRVARWHSWHRWLDFLLSFSVPCVF